MEYQDRLQRYEQEKKQLQNLPLTPEEYQRRVIQLADKYNI